MIQRTCLFIDDERQDDVFPIVRKEGLKYGLEIECLQFNVGNQERRDLLENEEISVPKVLKIFKEEFQNTKIHLIAFDWNIGSGLTGPTLIKRFNDERIRRNVAKILYSGVLKEEVQKLCDDYRKDAQMPFKKIWDQINALISTNTLDFVGKDDYERKVVQHLLKVEDTVEGTIEDELRKFPDFFFGLNFPNKNFYGMNFKEIADIIENDIHLRNDLTKEITQQVMAYLTEHI